MLLASLGFEDHLVGSGTGADCGCVVAPDVLCVLLHVLNEFLQLLLDPVILVVPAVMMHHEV